MNRELKRRASRSERASAADRQRAFRASAHDPRRWSRPLRVVTACATIIIMLCTAILPTFASTADGNMDGTYLPEYEAMDSINGFQVSTSTSTWNFDYNQKIVGYDPQTFADNQKTESVIYGPSTVLMKTLSFYDKRPTQYDWWTYEDDDYIDGAVKTRVLQLPTFTAYKKGGEIAGEFNCIVITMRAFANQQYAPIVNIKWGVYYQEDDIRNQYQAYTNVDGFTPNWYTAWHRKLDFKGRYNDLVYGNSIYGYTNYIWLLNNAKLYTSGPSEAEDIDYQYNENPFCRIMKMSLETEIISNEIVRGTTTYNLKRWWQTGSSEDETNTLYVTLKGKNVVIPKDGTKYIPYMNELPDEWGQVTPKYRTKATYSYYYVVQDGNTSFGDGFVDYIQVTKDFDTGWKSASDRTINLYPSFQDLFPNSIITDENGNPLGKANVYGLVINEFETQLAFPSYPNNMDWQIRISEYYYRGEEKEKRLVMNFVDDFDSEFYPQSNWSSLGKFISDTVGGFFDHKLFGVFSIGDILLVIIGIALVITFLKFFAGG